LVQKLRGRFSRDFSLDTSGFSASCYRKNHKNCSGSKGQNGICTCDCHENNKVMSKCDLL